MPRIGIIIGSNRPTRIATSISNYIKDAMAHENLELVLIDLAEINLPFLDEPEIPARHHYTKPHTERWSQLISSFDGFVLVFPQYNWGYPTVLKNAINYLYDEWSGKPVSLMCYGGHGGFQAALAMKLVTQGLHMHNMATNPPLDIDDEMFDEHGQFKDIEAAFGHYRQSFRAVSEEFADYYSRTEL